MNRRLPLVAALLSCSLIGCGDAADSEGATPKLRVLTANVGNPDSTDANYALRLSYQAYEDHVAAAIQALAPDIAFLQEVLPPETCEAFTEKDPGRTCFDAAARPPAARRLLGPDYTIVCDARLHVECIGVRTSFGSVDGVEPGAFALDGATTPALPLDPCTYFEGACDDDHCDAESTTSAVDVTSSMGAMRLVHVHPNAAGVGKDGFYMGEPCRYLQLEQMFEGSPPLVAEGKSVLVAGDFNMDPEGFATDREAALWTEHVGPDARFAEIGPPRNEAGKAYATAKLFAIDRVIGDGLRGSCSIHTRNVVEDDPAVLPALDHGFDFTQLPGGASSQGRMDHASISCEIEAD